MASQLGDQWCLGLDCWRVDHSGWLGRLRCRVVMECTGGEERQEDTVIYRTLVEKVAGHFVIYAYGVGIRIPERKFCSCRNKGYKSMVRSVH